MIASFAMEAFEKGVLSKDQVGYNLKWGDGAAIVRLIEDICLQRTEAGKILGLGTRGAANHLGKGSMHYAMQAKGLVLPGYVVRDLKTAALGFGVAIRGGCHLRNGSYSQDIKGEFDRLTQGKPIERVKSIIKEEDVYTLINSYIICKFTRVIYKNGVTEHSEVFNMVTGFDINAEFLLNRAQAILTLAKCFNLREGATKEDDYLPEREYTDPLPEGPSKGHVVDKKLYTDMLDVYYEERGWDKQGIPTDSTLKRLRLDTFVKQSDIHLKEKRRYIPCL